MGGAGADGYERSEGAAVIKMIYIILTLVSGILLSGVWFGLNFLIQICVEKSKVKFLERYSVIAASVIPLVFILKYNRLELWNYIRFVFVHTGYSVCLVYQHLYTMSDLQIKIWPENSNRDSGILSVFYGSRITIIKKRIYWTTYGRTFFRTYFEYNYP